MPKTTEEKAAELRDEARRHRAENYHAKRRAGFRCGEEGCKAGNQLLVVELPTESQDCPEKLGVRCPNHVIGYKIRPFQFNESQQPPADQAA
jgi:hypothetical protein